MGIDEMSIDQVVGLMTAYAQTGQHEKILEMARSLTFSRLEIVRTCLGDLRNTVDDVFAAAETPVGLVTR